MSILRNYILLTPTSQHPIKSSTVVPKKKKLNILLLRPARATEVSALNLLIILLLRIYLLSNEYDLATRVNVLFLVLHFFFPRFNLNNK